MLETLRAFGLDRLAAYEELGPATTRFLSWAEQFVHWVAATVFTADEPRANERLLAELGNLRAAWQLARTHDNIDLMATIVTTLYWPAAMRDIADNSNWALELAADSRIVEHPRGASVLGVASHASWSTTGDLHHARTLAERAIALVDADDTSSRQLCLDALGDVRLFEGRFDAAAALYVEAASVGSSWRHANYSSAGFALAYAGYLDEARVVNDQAASASFPSGLAIHHYAAGEIDNLTGAWTSAQHHYRRAIELSEISGATFIHNVAAVGLVSVQAVAGEVEAALKGYGELIDYWERTGSWIQQWTTLRNLAELLERLDDNTTAAFLRAAADQASDRTEQTPRGVAVDAPPHGQVHYGSAEYVAGTRSQVLEIARASISRHLEITLHD
jgi:tetratricopeptide (TPR) repeat protein